ncbi:MAG: hypothetical protein U0105_22310 [Candidatus Obscuribacterales bacterium]
MQAKGAGPVNRVELESQVLCAALRQSWNLKDKIGSFTSVRELSHLFPDLLPPPEDKTDGPSNKANYYELLGIRAQSSSSSVIAAYLRKVRKFLRDRKVREAKNEYNTLLNAGFILRKPRLRLSHDLVVVRRWLFETPEAKPEPSQEDTVTGVPAVSVADIKAAAAAAAAAAEAAKPALAEGVTPPKPVIPSLGTPTAPPKPPTPVAPAVPVEPTPAPAAEIPAPVEAAPPPPPPPPPVEAPVEIPMEPPPAEVPPLPVAPAVEEVPLPAAAETPTPPLPPLADLAFEAASANGGDQAAVEAVPPITPPLPAAGEPAAPAAEERRLPIGSEVDTSPPTHEHITAEFVAYDPSIGTPPTAPLPAADTEIPVDLPSPLAAGDAVPRFDKVEIPAKPALKKKLSEPKKEEFVFTERDLYAPRAEVKIPVPRIIQLMEAAQFIGSLEVKALQAQMQLAPNIPVEKLILNAGYVQPQELASLKLGETLLAQGRITMAQFQVAIYDERTSGLRMAESLQVRGWLTVETRNSIEEWNRKTK